MYIVLGIRDYFFHLIWKKVKDNLRKLKKRQKVENNIKIIKEKISKKNVKQ